MKKRTLLVACGTAIAIGLIGFLVPAVAAQRQADQREFNQPVAVGYDHPVAAAEPESDQTQGPADNSAVNEPMPSAMPAVNPATYHQQKAAAEYGPVATGADVVPPPAAAPVNSETPSAEAPNASFRFEGLTRQSVAANNTAPPDTILAKSDNRILEGVNRSLRLFTNTGSVIQTVDLNTFFGASTSNGLLFDPKVFYDRRGARPRFFVVALQQAGRGDTNAANNVSRIHVAVSRSSDPSSLGASNWCRYNIDGRRNTGTSDVSWADYPGIGVGLDSFSFSMNNFRFTDDQFTYSVVHFWNKNTATNNASSCPSLPRFVWQPSSTIGNGNIFTIQPAQHYTTNSSFTGTTNPAYYMSTSATGSSNQYRVYRVANVASGSPKAGFVTLTGAQYSTPANSPQPGTSVRIHTGDNRMLQVAGIGSNLVGIFTAACQFTGGANESCTRTPRVTVGQNNAGGLSASLVENTFAGYGDNIFVHHASIATNTSLQSGSNWESSGAGRYLRSNAEIKNVNGPWTNVAPYAPGSCSQPITDAGRGLARSGDYSGAQLASGLASFWLAGEYSASINGVCQWRTRIAQLVP